MENRIIKLFQQYRANEFWQSSGWEKMADKTSILNQLPGAGNADQSDIIFRINRVPPGDKGEGQVPLLEHESPEKDLAKPLDSTTKIIPREGEIIPPPTAAEVLQEQKKTSSSVDYCAPVQYQTLPRDEVQGLGQEEKISTDV
ncbi:hypothetical protein BgiBS90_004733 [Biomphalaria glabrata]|uniref:Uncharacterized protein n=1 Tax=Biomphalaria glabrata TaxID=6526 RepID=A0A2C9KN24_BIOGL|nr:hypothetical protein BgiBS90_004733 [Biomphalaria glabrata]